MSSHRPPRARTGWRSEPDAIRITTAGSDPQADLRRRQRKYVLAMTIRTLCFIGAAATGAAGWHYVWPFLIVGAIVLPYVAVVMANANDSRSVELPLTGGGEAQRLLRPAPAEPPIGPVDQDAPREDPRGT